MKKIMITGCSGYIGSHLCELLKKDYEVHGLDIVPPQVEINRFYQVDINRLFTIPDQLEPYDAVIHLAALVNVGESEKMPIMYYITNLNGTMNVLNKIPTDNFIFASTGAAALCESVYGISKRAAEDCVREYFDRHQPEVPYTIFRFYNVIGSDYGIKPTNRDGLMYNLFKAKETGKFTIFGNDYDTKDGTCIRDYVHVIEICQALAEAIENPSNKLENLGHGVGYTVKEMVKLFEKANNCDIQVEYAPRRKGDAAVSVLEDVSPYMKNMYTIEDLLRVNI